MSATINAPVSLPKRTREPPRMFCEIARPVMAIAGMTPATVALTAANASAVSAVSSVMSSDSQFCPPKMLTFICPPSTVPGSA